MAGNRKVSYVVESEKEKTVASQTDIKIERRKEASPFQLTQKITAEQASTQVNNQHSCPIEFDGQNRFKLNLIDRDQKQIFLNQLNKEAHLDFEKTQISVALGDPQCPISESDDQDDSTEKNSTTINNINSFQIEFQQSNSFINGANARQYKQQMPQYPQLFSYQDSSEQKQQQQLPEEAREIFDQHYERYSKGQKQEHKIQEKSKIEETTSPPFEQNLKELNIVSIGRNNYHGNKQHRHSSFNNHVQENSQFPQFHPKLSFQMAQINNSKELSNLGNQNSQVLIPPVKKMSTSVSRKFSANIANNNLKINCSPGYQGCQSNPSNQRKTSEQFSKKRRMYFGEDKSSSGNCSPTFLHGSESNIKKEKSGYLGKSNEVLFRSQQFCEILLFYLIFCYCLGPLTVFLIKLKTGSFHLAFNIGILGKDSAPSNLLYCSFFIVTITCFLLPLNESKQITRFYEEFCLIYFLFFFKQSIKFGYISPAKFQKYKSRFLKKFKRKEDMLRGEWKDQTTVIVSRELQDSLSRNEIELSSFLLEFTCPPKKHVINDLGGLQGNKQGLRVFNQERNSDKFIRCDNILLFYIQKYNKFFRIQISKRALIITLIRSAYCVWFKVFREYSEYSHLNWRPILILSLMVSMESYCLFYFIQLAYILLDSLQRKEFIMVQLSYLISPKKLEVLKSENSKKLLPTMQIACPLSIRAWSQLRQAALDYGQSFDRFCNFFLSCYMLIFQLLCGFLLLNYFNFISVLTTSLSDVLMTIVELFVLFILTLDCFFTTAALNDQFDTHCKLLFQNMQTFSEISYNYAPLYTHKSFNISNQIFKTILHSFSAIIKSFDSRTTDIEEYSWYLMQMYSNLIKELRIIQICQPLKILNVAVSKNLVTQLVLSVLSILIALLWNEFIKPAIVVTTRE